MLKKTFILLVIISLILFSINCKTSSTTEENQKEQELKEGIGIGNIAPDFTEKDSNNKDFTLSSYKGKVILLVFSAVWCGPCNNEASKLESLYTKYKDQGFEIVQILYQDENGSSSDASDLKEWKEKYNLTFKVLSDPDSSTVNKYAVYAIPLNVIIDKDFIIRYRKEGFYESDVDSKINELLNN